MAKVPKREDSLLASLSDPKSEVHMYVDAVFGEPVDVDGDFDDRHIDVDNDGIGIAAPRAGLASESARAPISSEFELEPMDDAGGSGLRPHQSSSAMRSSAALSRSMSARSPSARSPSARSPSADSTSAGAVSSASTSAGSISGADLRLALEPGLALDDADLALPARPQPPPRPPPPIARPPSAGRPWARRLLVGLVLVGVGVGGWFGARALLERADGSADLDAVEAEAGLRRIRVAGDDAPSHAGFRQHHMDKLATTDGVLFTYVPSVANDPRDALKKLADGEVELALTTLDRVLLARGGGALSGKIVAVVGVSLGADAVVLDTKEYPGLRSLGDLPGFGAQAELEPILAQAKGSRGDYFGLRVDTLLRAIDAPALTHADDYADQNAVYNALLADGDERAPVVAGVLGEPWLGMAVAAGMSVALSTRDLPRAVVDVLVVGEPLLTDDPALVETIVGTYYAGLAAQAPPRPKLAAQIAQDMNLADDDAARVLAGLCLLDAGGAAPWLRAPEAGRPLLTEAVAATWSTLREAGRVEGETPSLDELVDARALTALTQAGTSEAAATLDACLAASAAKGSSGRALGELELPHPDQAWFAADEAVLTDAGASALHELATRLRAFNPATVTAEITGYADEPGKGRGLGQSRAKAIVDALEREGVTLELRARGANADELPPPRIRVALTRR